MGLEKPDHIKTILSSPLPIFIEFKCSYKNITGGALWRMRAALRYHDRAREIAFDGTRGNFYESSRRPIALFPYWRALLFALEGATKQRSQIHFESRLYWMEFGHVNFCYIVL